MAVMERVMNHTERLRLNEFVRRLAEISDTDVAWFTGWLCADGSIRFVDKQVRPGIKFQICDRDPLERFSELFGGKVSRGCSPSQTGWGKKPCYYWCITGHFAVALLRRCLPWMSQRYAEKAQRAMNYKTKEHYGRKLSPDQVAEIKTELANGTHGVNRRMAIKFGVTDGMIANIKHGRAWTGKATGTPKQLSGYRAIGPK
jgi:hypothetical protein